LLCVGDAHRIGSGPGSFERVSDSQRDVLAVIAHDVILEWWPPLVADTFESRSQNRAEDFSDVLAMKNRAHAGHFLRRGSVEFDSFALCDGRFACHAMEQPGKMEVVRFLRFPVSLQRPTPARVTPAEGWGRRGLFGCWLVRSFPRLACDRHLQRVRQTTLGQF